MPATVLHTRDGVLDKADQAQLDQLAKRLNGAKVLVHLHGGLVDNDKGEEIAERLSGPAPAGWGQPADVEQVYVVWRTGALETVRTNWRDLFDNDRIYRTLLKKLLSFAASKMGVPGGPVGRTAFHARALTPTEINDRLDARPAGDPFADVNIDLELQTPAGRGPVVQPETDGAIALQFMALLQQDLEFSLAADDIAAALTFDKALGRSLAPRGDRSRGEAALARLNEEARTGLASATPTAASGRVAFAGLSVTEFLIKRAARTAIRVIGRLRHRRDHGLYATIVEELTREFYGDLVGAAIWGMIKKDAGDHFSPGGLGHALVASLVSSRPAKLFVTGHSAGSIWAAHMLKAMASWSDTPKLRMALLAPAVRIDLFEEAIAAGGGLVEALRVFAMSDALERADAVLGPELGFIYPSSLLYLVSGAFEELGGDGFSDAPLLGMQRFQTIEPAWLTDPGQIASVSRAMAFLTTPNNRIVLSPASGGRGFSCQAKSHGDFDRDRDTLASVTTFLS